LGEEDFMVQKPVDFDGLGGLVNGEHIAVFTEMAENQGALGAYPELGLPPIDPALNNAIGPGGAHLEEIKGGWRHRVGAFTFERSVTDDKKLAITAPVGRQDTFCKMIGPGATRCEPSHTQQPSGRQEREGRRYRLHMSTGRLGLVELTESIGNQEPKEWTRFSPD